MIMTSLATRTLGSLCFCLIVVGCQSKAEYTQGRIQKLDEYSRIYNSCQNPMIVVHQSTGDAMYSSEDRQKAMHLRGYDVVIERDPNPCPDPAISTFILGFQIPESGASVAALYTSHLSKSQAFNDPALECKAIKSPISNTQGGVSFITAGYSCEKKAPIPKQ